MSRPNPEQPNPEQPAENHDPREGLWDPERTAHERQERHERQARPAPVPSGPRKRALPKSWVSNSLWILIGLVLVAALLGIF